MNDESQAPVTAGWTDWLLSFVAIASVLLVLVMWTTSIPIHIGT